MNLIRCELGALVGESRIVDVDGLVLGIRVGVVVQNPGRKNWEGTLKLECLI